MTHTNNTEVITATPFERADALRTAREVLTVKAGKYAVRDLDAYALVAVAQWILDGDTNVTLENLLVENLDDLGDVTGPSVIVDMHCHPSHPSFVPASVKGEDA